MKAFVVACSLAALALCGEGRAADLPAPVYKAATVTAPIPYDWSGYHVGGNVGYGWGRADTSIALTSLPLAPISTTMNGWIAGAQVGRDWQLNKIVLGIESSIEATGQHGSSGIGPGTVCLPGMRTCVTGTGSLDEKLPWLATFRGRLGVTPMDRLLVYVTGGGAIAEVDVGSSFTATVALPGHPPLASASTSSTNNAVRVGWTIGLGAEWALWDHWTAKLEVEHVDFGTGSKAFTGPNALMSGTASNGVTDNIATIGMNYRFDLPGLVFPPQ
jgi:outer membrane immunogenic protein